MAQRAKFRLTTSLIQVSWTAANQQVGSMVAAIEYRGSQSAHRWMQLTRIGKTPHRENYNLQQLCRQRIEMTIAAADEEEPPPREMIAMHFLTNCHLDLLTAWMTWNRRGSWDSYT
ncbi:uncharacterized protein LOC126260064 [Schistocerca nitens]|uniref:uncharacterized protein LOC126260064 n=1 Tax=Schistocerca nitens TaxID=7011 RepID=UPI00211752EE|nr:uncharacterized protein LOC126260064 [Schistocerca nitens]